MCAAGMAFIAMMGLASGARASPELDRLLDWGLSYLASAEDEVGVDVAVLLEVVAERSGDERARGVSQLLRLAMEPEKVTPFESLFGVPKPVLDVRVVSAARGPRADNPEDSRLAVGPRMSDCLVAAASCSITPACERVALDQSASGKRLAHQAVWLLFVRWLGCSTEVDLDALGSKLVVRLRAEIAADSSYTETALERLAMLGELGHADEISPLWWPTIVGAQGGEGCWGAEAGGRCHPHPTILALWALAHLDAARTRDTPAGR